VYALASESRTFRGKPDQAYYITFKSGGRKIWEKIGWRSEGITAVFASQVRAERMRSMRLGDVSFAPRRKFTFGQAFEKYDHGHLVQLKSADRVRRMYAARLEKTFATRQLSAITPWELERFKQHLLAEGLAPATVTMALGVVRAVYRKMRDWNLYDGPIPTEKVKLPKKDNRRMRFLTPEEADVLLSELAKTAPETYAMALVSLHTGMRFGEIAGLRGEHIDLAARTIRIADAKNSRGRTVYMTQKVRDILSQRPLLCGRYVFPGRGGGRRSDVSDAFARCVARLGLNKGRKDRRDRVVFHTLRHTYASWLVQGGTPLYTVGELLGHSSVEMTRRYSHLAPDAFQATIAIIEECTE